MCWRGKIHAGRLKMVHEKRTVFNRTAPTPYSEDSRCPLAACITRVLSWVRSLQFIDNKLHCGSFLFEVILAAGSHNPVPKPPDHTGSRLSGLTAKTSALPGLSFKVLQLGFEKHRLGCRKGNEENSNEFLQKRRKAIYISISIAQVSEWKPTKFQILYRNDSKLLYWSYSILI